MEIKSNENKTLTELIERLLPGKSSLFRFEKTASETDEYYVERKNGKIVLGGSNVNSICMALGYYLKHIANADISWSCISEPIEIDETADFERYYAKVPQKYRTYMNFCTHSYSCAWWDRERWEKEIDIMALNGVNLPLSVTGTEAVWYETLLELGFSDNEAREYLVGPAFLAWQLMGNIESFSGPLPLSRIEKSKALGKWILTRQTELGMTPLQQGFTGCVPMAFIDKFKDSKILLKKHWNNISRTAQLDPSDDLFMTVGRIYMKNLEKLFGLHGYYCADPFHEGEPPKKGSQYLADVGKIIAGLMKESDENYTWVMQAWSLRKDIATAVPKEHLLIFDLRGTTVYNTEGFWGYDFVVGSLHNFGARMNLHGDVKRLAENQYITLKSRYENAVGTGLFMEGIGQNPLYYDLAFDMLASGKTVNLDEWIKGYAKRRYKTSDSVSTGNIKAAIDLVYAEGSDKMYNCASLICSRPSLDVKSCGPCDSFDETYDNGKLFAVAENYKNIKSMALGFKYDKLDLLRQALSNYALTLYRSTMKCYADDDFDGFLRKSEQFKDLLRDMDKLTYQIPEWRMETWTEAAKAAAENEEEARLYEYNAREQVTFWGNEEKSLLFDYAWKEWSGLISGYYLMRWTKFFDMLTEKHKDGEKYTEDGLEVFEGRIVWDADDFRRKLAKDEVEWAHSADAFEPCREDDGLFDSLIEKYQCVKVGEFNENSGDNM